MAGLSGRRTMVAVRTAVTLCPWSRLNRARNHNPCRYLPSYGPRTPNIFRNNVNIRRFYKYRNIPIKSKGSGPGNENGTRLAKMIIYPHHAKAPPIRSKNDH